MFAGLEPEVRQRVIAAAVPRTYRKGQLLFVETTPAIADRPAPRRGRGVPYRPTGERAVLSVFRPPDVLGEVPLDASTRSASAEAIEDCAALALFRAAFMELVHSPAHPGRGDALAGRADPPAHRAERRPRLPRPPGRVAKTLVRLAGESQAPMITIELNQSQLAEMAGGSRQSVNQAIGSFASRGWLRTEGRRIVVTTWPRCAAAPA